MSEKRLVETIDATPTWAEIAPTLLSFLETGSAKQRELARAELLRMATIADAYNAMQRELAAKICVCLDEAKSPARGGSRS